MIKDILSFIIYNNKYASDFQKTPIILSAAEHLNLSKEGQSNFPKKILFENVEVNIINISKYLGINEINLIPSTKLIVGEIEHRFIGFLVDQVVEIINLNNELCEQINETISQKVNGESTVINLAGEKVNFIDIDDVLKNILY